MVYLLFFCSGVSGLIYQIVWVRAFGNVFGNTIHSASLVIAVFMLGLGVGGYGAGRWADRRYVARPDSLLRVFGYVELTIGALALGVSMLLPHLGEVSAAASSYTRGPDGWYTLSPSSHVARAGLAVVLLTPVTLLMGGTLTLVIRHLVRGDPHIGGWRIATLYGVNTAGAAVGCLATDFALVPAYGMRGAQWTAVFLNLATGVGAIILARGTRTRLVPGTTTDQPDHPGRTMAARVRRVRRQPDSVSRESSLLWAGLAIALSGFAAMGMEIVWFRHLSMLLGEYRAVFALLLAVILCGFGGGALAGGWLGRHGQHPVPVWMIVQALFVASALLGLVSVDARQLQALQEAAVDGATRDGWGRTWVELWFNAKPILVITGVPSLLMGLTFPLANALIQRAESRVGRQAGLLYLANTAGAVAGSVAAGFLLLPALGVQASTTLLLAVAGMAIAPLYAASPTEPQPGRPWVTAGSLIVAGTALGAWLVLPANALISRALLFPIERAYAVSEGLTEVIAVTDGPNGGRVLVTNGHPMSSTELFSQRYMRAMAHIPLLSLDTPGRVLVICYGVGNTAHAATLHPSVQRVDVVDLSEHVLEHSSYFTDVNENVLASPRVNVYINDGRHHLRMTAPEAYDLITLEPPPIVHAGVASLYSREFYASARLRLAPHGYLSQWLPVFGVPHATILSMIRSFLHVFPNAVLLSGAGANLLLVGQRDAPNTIDPGRMAASLARAPAVHADLQRLDLGTVRDIVGTFVASSSTLAAATRDSSPVTDDRPIQEYGKRSLLEFGDGGIPPAVIAVGEADSWCPTCFSGGRPTAAVAGLDVYLALNELAYRSPAGVSARTHATARGRTVAGSGYLGTIVPESPELDRLLRAWPEASDSVDDAVARYTAATTLLESGRFVEAVAAFERVLQLRPDSLEALNNLGVALASLGRLDEASSRFERALTLDPAFEDARRNLALARAKAGR